MNITERITENMRVLCKMNDEKLGTFEKDVLEATPGYLSREKKSINAEHLYKTSVHFGVSIDDLTKRDFWEVYKKDLARNELEKAIRHAEKIIGIDDTLDVVNTIIEENGGGKQ